MKRISKPMTYKELENMNYDRNFEVMLDDHETLDMVVVFECDGEFYHLDMLYSSELEF